MLTIAARDSLFASWAPTHVSLHSAWPSDSGLNELSGGTYARAAITIGASSGAKRVATTTPTINVPAGATVRFVGLWSAVTGGNFLGVFPLSGIEQRFFAEPVTDRIRCKTHGYQNGRTVVFMSGSLPSQIAPGTSYYVINATPDDFQIAAVAGGAPILFGIASAGPCKVSLIEEYTNQLASTIKITGLQQRLADTVVNVNPVWVNLPTITFVLGQGRSVDMLQYVTSPSGLPITITQPASDPPLHQGVTYNSITHLLTYDGNGPVGGGNHQFLADDTPAGPPPGVLAVNFTMTSPLTGNFPFAWGHPFKQGDVPAGSTVLGNISRFHFIPINYWSDGSVKWGYVTGKASFTANVPKVIALTSGSIVSQPVLQESALATAIIAQPPNINFVGVGNVALANLIGTPSRVVYLGSESSSWFYGAKVGTDVSMSAWYEVKLFKDGEVQVILPSFENRYTTGTGQINKVGACTVAMGSTIVYNQASLDVKCGVHLPLVQAQVYSYWNVTDPQVTPSHDGVYLRNTMQVPNYYPATPSVAQVSIHPQSYVPPFAVVGGTQAMLGTDGVQMGATGNQLRIGLNAGQNVPYITTNGRLDAFHALIINGLTAGSWGGNTHIRDGTTMKKVLWVNNQTLYLPDLVPSTGGVYGVRVGSNFIPSSTDSAHLPNYAYIPYLITGWHWFLEEHHHWTDNCIGNVHWQFRFRDKGIFSTGQTRHRAWCLNVLAHAAAITPPDHPKSAEYISMWAWNMDHLKARFRTGTFDESIFDTQIGNNPPNADGGWVNELGLVWPYPDSDSSQRSGYDAEGTPPRFFQGPSNGAWNNNPLPTPPTGSWYEASWMQAFFCMMLGNSWDLGILQSVQSKADHLQIRDWKYRHVVALCGDGSPGTWDYRRFDPYQFPVFTNGEHENPPRWFPDYGAMYNIYVNEGNTATGVPMRFLTPADGTTILYHGDAFPLTQGDYTGGFAANHMPAIALAVDHGAPGAVAGRARITGSSNYFEPSSGNQQWAVKPRTGI